MTPDTQFSQYFLKYEHWTSLLPDPIELPEYELLATPLTTPQALLDETNDMKHNVVMYSKKCSTGHYRVFHLQPTNGNNDGRATMVLRLKTDKWVLNSVHGRHNTCPPPEMLKAAEIVTTMYNNEV